MAKKRPRPLWYLLLSNAVPVVQLALLAGFILLAFRLVVYFLGGPLLWF